MAEERERWGSRMGLVLAAAGNAVGIGNLLRFPSQAAQNGGGAFMIPYVTCLIVFGLPMMWIIWTIGRYGGARGHSTLPGMLHEMWGNRAAKYIGVLGLALPMVFCLYYTYIETWCLAYAWFSLTGEYANTAGRHVDLQVFLNEFLGQATSHSYFKGLSTALVFVFITLALNIWVLSRGISKGIEMLAKIAMPLLLGFCVLLSIRVLTLKGGAGTAWDGLSFLYTPDFSRLSDPNVWMAAAGQIFFTLSIGFGSIECYASYLRHKEDVTLAGATTSATNEFVEIIFGSMIAIPAAAVFYGPDMIATIASGGSYAIGMVAMPEILRSFPLTQFFGTAWFLLLFFAAFTSSVAVCQPVVAFLQDECKLSRRSAAALVGMIWFLGTLPVLYFFKYGVLDELDYWAGTVGLVVVALVEVVIFSFVFGVNRGWDEMHQGHLLKVPRFFKFIMKYVTPVALLAVLVGWAMNPTMPVERVLIWNVAERASYEGEFVTAATDESRRIQTAVLDQVKAKGRDLSAWAEIEVDAAGTVRVLDLSADPGLSGVFDETVFEKWLEAQGFRYMVNKQATPVQLTIGVEALNRKPFIWLSRMIILFFFGLFLTLIAGAWHRSRKEAKS